MRLQNAGDAASSGVIDRKRGVSPSPGKLNAKIGPPSGILIFGVLFVFSLLLFFLRFLGIFVLFS